MHPESYVDNIDREAYISDLFSKIKKRLNKGGLLSIQCCSKYDIKMLNFIKRALPKYFNNVRYTSSYIPSYCEEWVFATGEV